MHTYNTTAPAILIKSYGRGVQQLVRSLAKIEEPAKRASMAHALLPVMQFLSSPTRKEATPTAKTWQDLCTIAAQPLDIPSPYAQLPTLPRTAPSPLRYPTKQFTPTRYGRYLTHLMHDVAATQDKEEQTAHLTTLIRTAGFLRRHVYDPNLILQQIEAITDKHFDIDLTALKQAFTMPTVKPSHPYRRRNRRYRRRRS